MPELPDILLYLHALRPRIVGHQVRAVRLASPFLLRSVDPPLASVEGRRIVDLHRLGKRVAMEAEGELYLVFHLMIAGRFKWQDPGTRIPGKVGLFALDFDRGTLILTEAGTLTLTQWITRLQRETGDAFPEKVTAFRDGMAVHGRYGQPCPDCGSPVQRIVYASNEANYCATCQTGGRLLADRSLSRLLREDWPRTLDELERKRRG